MSLFWCEQALLGGREPGGAPDPGSASRPEHGVLLETAGGRITAIRAGAPCPENAVRLPGVVLPGPVNAHSHAFHRLLRGRTHAGGGTFWTWREQMYALGAHLTPELYARIATAVYAEMVVTGWTAVGEFHYVHHAAPDGPAQEPHAMELALARAAEASGIRLRLLDTCYLSGGIGARGEPVPLGPAQQRFSDGDAEGWLRRHRALGEALAASHPGKRVQLGAAVHSLRAVPRDSLATFAGLEEPVHMHVSEQPQENEDCRAAFGASPVEVIAEAGLLGPGFSAVHATHLSARDIALLGEAGANVVMCPTTEADLADGIGPARALARVGASIALGTDQHAVVDPLLEARALEHGERLVSGERGRFSPEELLTALSSGGARSLGLEDPAGPERPAGIVPGGRADLIAVRTNTLRTAGSRAGQVLLSGTAADVAAVVIGGRLEARDGVHLRLGDPASLYREVLEELP